MVDGCAWNVELDGINIPLLTLVSFGLNVFYLKRNWIANKQTNLRAAFQKKIGNY